jgi:hypothetical protein
MPWIAVLALEGPPAVPGGAKHPDSQQSSRALSSPLRGDFPVISHARTQAHSGEGGA